MAKTQVNTLNMFGVVSLKVWFDDEESLGEQWGSWNIPGLDKVWYMNIQIKFLVFKKEGHITLY